MNIVRSGQAPRFPVVALEHEHLSAPVADWSAMMMPMTSVSAAAGERLIALVSAAEAPLLARLAAAGMAS